ncbi:hypothetical protein FB567DRAFT_11916 [Paraphoma chrysanthemicola]|uniref:Uncharacterized protein n=1 Tax=Paraphoma chrysanthemicola TaxID=798071 RepID=A0A8K0W516_9PLEO|nr:hypothetical protein FB567DRAFT_11916 [Paraphoma chrysanthemicola]
MDYDDAVPPPIRRSPRAALVYQTVPEEPWFEDSDSEEAAPTFPHRQSASRERGALQDQSPSTGPNVLGAPQPSPAKVTNFSRHRYSHPLRQQLQRAQPVETLPEPPPPIPHRSPARLKSFRRDKRMPLHLRRRTSLETIESVTTTPSVASDDDEQLDPPEARAPSPYFFTLEEDPAATPVALDARSLASSNPSSDLRSTPSYNETMTPVPSVEAEPHSPKTLFQKMRHRKGNMPTCVPERLVIERKVSFDRTSHRSSLTNSNQSNPSERQFGSGLFETERSRSGSSSEWSASSFDITSLTESEIKKCKKKGINPSLYAEMKAARKGKWTSPIAGNTFL